MVSWATGVVLLMFLLFPYAAAVQLSDCPLHKRDVLENSVIGEDCDCLSGDRTSTVTWKHVSDTGQESVLGVCHAPKRCTAAGPSVSSLGRDDRTSFIDINITREMSGSLVCQESFSNGNVDTTNCSLNVMPVTLHFCYEGGFMEVNNTSPIIYASLSTDTPSTVSWTLVSSNGKKTDLGTCTNISSCVSPLSPYVTVERPSLSYSTLRIRNIRQETVGTIVVTSQHRGTVDSANCTLDVVLSEPPEVECSLEMYRDNWTFVGSCNVSKAFSALGRYRYGFYMGLCRRSCESLLGLLPFSPSLYFDDTINAERYRGSYMDTWPVPGQNGRYCFQSQTIPDGTKYTFPSYRIVEPHRPTHNCTDLKFIPERGEVSCTCRTTSVGLPEGRLIWFWGDAALATGDYGTTNLTFSSAFRERNSDGVALFCYLDWPVGYKTVVTSKVAYGPDGVDMQYWSVLDPYGTVITVIVSCNAVGSNPVTMDMITWGDLCQGQKGFNCTLHMPEVDGKEVTCVATNAANNGHAVTASVLINGFTLGQSEASGFWNRDLAKGIGMGVGLVLLLLVVVAVVVLLVLWRRGKLPLCCDPVYDQPSKRRKKREDDERTYTGLNLPVTSDRAPRNTGTMLEATTTGAETEGAYEIVDSRV